MHYKCCSEISGIHLSSHMLYKTRQQHQLFINCRYKYLYILILYIYRCFELMGKLWLRVNPELIRQLVQCGWELLSSSWLKNSCLIVVHSEDTKPKSDQDSCVVVFLVASVSRQRRKWLTWAPFHGVCALYIGQVPLLPKQITERWETGYIYRKCKFCWQRATSFLSFTC